jgi:hypothetical protein
MFKELWVSRRRWQSSAAAGRGGPAVDLNFQTKVVVRFRPARPGTAHGTELTVTVPLHQRLQMIRSAHNCTLTLFYVDDSTMVSATMLHDQFSCK